ncbi:hypothetical protein MRX96_043386 [Rhipicephalus microplus]
MLSCDHCQLNLPRFAAISTWALTFRHRREGIGMGMDGMDDYDDMPIMAGASRPWLSTTAILVLLSVFLISLVGIILFSLYLYFLQGMRSTTIVEHTVIRKRKHS